MNNVIVTFCVAELNKEFTANPTKNFVAREHGYTHQTTVEGALTYVSFGHRFVEFYQGDFTGMVVSDLYPMTVTAKTPITATVFRERDYGHYFTATQTTDEWAQSCGLTHEMVNDNGKVTYLRLLKTVAYVCVDEDELGLPVLEKWQITTTSEKEVHHAA